MWILPVGAFAGETKDMASGVLEGRRVSFLVCEMINKSGDTLSDAALTLKAPDGSPIGPPPLLCPPLAHGETCVLEHEIAFPDLDLAAYCHASLPKAFVRGSLRLLDKNRNTLAQSDLEADLHGKVALLESDVRTLRTEMLAVVGAPLVVAFMDLNDNNMPDDGVTTLIAKIVDGDSNGVPSAGDIFVPGRYPGDFGPTDRPNFDSGPSECVAIVLANFLVQCATESGDLVEFSLGGGETFTDGGDVLIRDVNAGGSGDDVVSVLASSVGPLQPEQNVDITQTSMQNDKFIRLNFFYPQ